jgi:stage III sporulation protein AH
LKEELMEGKTWKKNAVVAVVLLFICVGVYLNWSYSREEDTETTSVELADTIDTALLEEASQDTETIASVDAITEDVVVVSDNDDYEAMLTEATTDTTVSDYFAAIRLSRQESRDSAVELLQETIAYETGEDTEAASTASTKLEDMVTTALKEAEIEGLVIAKGYEDCVAYMSENAISVAVAAPEEGLEADAVAQICDIVTTQSDYTPSELKIIEVK